MSELDIIPTGGALGADIKGVDLSSGVDAATFFKILDAWSEHLVLRFRGQSLDEDSLTEFSARFGTLDMAPTRPANVPHHPSRPEINVLSNIVMDGVPIGGLGNSELVWHQDMSYKELPPKASILYGIETPETGGDTWFYNLQSAYEALPDSLKHRLQGLTCKHDLLDSFLFRKNPKTA